MCEVLIKHMQAIGLKCVCMIDSQQMAKGVGLGSYCSSCRLSCCLQDCIIVCWRRWLLSKSRVVCMSAQIGAASGGGRKHGMVLGSIGFDAGYQEQLFGSGALMTVRLLTGCSRGMAAMLRQRLV